MQNGVVAIPKSTHKEHKAETHFKNHNLFSALLRETDKPISDIDGDVGFGQPCHFGKCFREKTGLSPSEYDIGKV